MIKTSFSNKNKFSKIKNHFIFEKTLTPIKIIPKDKIYDKESNTSGKIQKQKHQIICILKIIKIIIKIKII